jgi:elongation factor 1-beta
MSQIVATMKIFPNDINIDLNKLKTSIRKDLPKNVSVYRFDEEPIAFGLVAIIAHIIMPESNSGEMDRIEESLRKIDAISEVEVILVRRI